MSTPAATAGDDRVRTRSATATFFGMPAVGALIGAIALAVLFMAVAPAFRSVDNIGTILYSSSTIGIMAVFVALLMIGGEFDLSTGVAVTTAGLAAAHSAWWFNFNVWVGVLISLLLALAIGAFNGWLLHITKLPSFLVTLGTYFVFWGANLAVTRIVTGGVSSNAINDMAGFNSAHAVFASEFSIGPIDIKIPIVYWILLTLAVSFCCARNMATGSSPPVVIPRLHAPSVCRSWRPRSRSSWAPASPPGYSGCTRSSNTTRCNPALAPAMSSSTSLPPSSVAACSRVAMARSSVGPSVP